MLVGWYVENRVSSKCEAEISEKTISEAAALRCA